MSKNKKSWANDQHLFADAPWNRWIIVFVSMSMWKSWQMHRIVVTDGQFWSFLFQWHNYCIRQISQCYYDTVQLSSVRIFICSCYAYQIVKMNGNFLTQSAPRVFGSEYPCDQYHVRSKVRKPKTAMLKANLRNFRANLLRIQLS